MQRDHLTLRYFPRHSAAFHPQRALRRHDNKSIAGHCDLTRCLEAATRDDKNVSNLQPNSRSFCGGMEEIHRTVVQHGCYAVGFSLERSNCVLTKRHPAPITHAYECVAIADA